MSLPRPLRNELFRYWKHKQISLDGTVAGREHYRPRGEYATADVGPWGLPPQEYVPPPPQAYEPHPGFARFPEPEYEAYEPHSVFQPTTPSLRVGPGSMNGLSPQGLPEETEAPCYNDCLMDQALSRDAWQQALESDHIPELASQGADIAAGDNLDGLESLEQIIDQEMALMPLSEIEAAIDQQMNDALSPPEPELPDLFDQQMQQMDEQMRQLLDPFGMWGPGLMG